MAEKNQLAFDTLKQKLCETPVLRTANFNQTFINRADV